MKNYWEADVDVRKADYGGIGLFAGQEIGSGEIIGTNLGREVEFQRFDNLKVSQFFFAVPEDDSKREYSSIVPVGEVMFLNHSIDPNVKVKLTRLYDELWSIEVSSIKSIMEGDELVITYSDLDRYVKAGLISD